MMKRKVQKKMLNEEVDIQMMKSALKEAQKAAEENEVPVGAVITYEGKIISTGKNKRESSLNALHHAETEAIYKACQTLKRWRLTGCTLYVTLEPCAMCAGSIINSRISKVVYGAKDLKSGSCESVINLFDLPYNHKPEVIGGILEEECSFILSEFFKKLRNKKLK